jgi:hypothetical protein
VCARFPIARMSVSVGVREMLGGKRRKARSQAPVAPKTPIRPILRNNIE